MFTIDYSYQNAYLIFAFPHEMERRIWDCCKSNKENYWYDNKYVRYNAVW